MYNRLLQFGQNIMIDAVSGALFLDFRTPLLYQVQPPRGQSGDDTKQGYQILVQVLVWRCRVPIDFAVTGIVARRSHLIVSMLH